MGNVLKMDQQHIIQTLIGLGWTNRAIHRETGIHRDTISRYRRRFENRPIVPIGESTENQNRPKVPTDSPGQTGPIVPIEPGAPPTTKSSCIQGLQPRITEKYRRGLSSRRIYQDLVEEAGYGGSYDSVRRYVKKLRRKIPVYRHNTQSFHEPASALPAYPYPLPDIRRIFFCYDPLPQIHLQRCIPCSSRQTDRRKNPVFSC